MAKSLRFLLLTASVAGGVCPVQGQESNRFWTFGGEGGHAWPDWVEVNVMADDFSVPGALQPRELKPDENLLPILHELHPFAPMQSPTNPFWVDGMPRFWRWYGNLDDSNKPGGFGDPSRIGAYVDGDHTTFHWYRQHRRMDTEWYTIDVGALVPLERFALQMPPGTTQFDEPWVNWVPRHGELTASRDEAQLAEEALVVAGMRSTYSPRTSSQDYRPLDIFLGSVGDNLIAPIEFRFPLQYLRFVRWRAFPSGGDLRPDLAYAEFELYGRGIAAESGYVTRPVDLGRPATLGRVFFHTSKWRRQSSRWDETTDADGNVERRGSRAS